MQLIENAIEIYGGGCMGFLGLFFCEDEWMIWRRTDGGKAFFFLFFFSREGKQREGGVLQNRPGKKESQKKGGTEGCGEKLFSWVFGVIILDWGLSDFFLVFLVSGGETLKPWQQTSKSKKLIAFFFLFNSFFPPFLKKNMWIHPMIPAPFYFTITAPIVALGILPTTRANQEKKKRRFLFHHLSSPPSSQTPTISDRPFFSSRFAFSRSSKGKSKSKNGGNEARVKRERKKGKLLKKKKKIRFHLCYLRKLKMAGRFTKKEPFYSKKNH